MARKIRFPLKMTNGTEVRTIEELRAYFDLTAVLGYYADGKLVTWLRDRYLDSEADKIEALVKDSKSFQNDLCAALGVEAPSGPDEAGGEFDMDYINRRNEKKRILRTITDDEEIIYKVDQVALNQDDLLDIYEEGRKEIYLCQGEFEIPLSVTDVTYIGVADPIVTVRVTDNVNFKEKNIKFVDCVYGWDVSNTSPLDNINQAEHLFLKGDYQKAVSVLENYANQDNPRTIFLLSRIYKNYLHNDEKLDFYSKMSKQAGDVLNTVKSISNEDCEKVGKYIPLLKKLAKNGNPIDEWCCAYAFYLSGKHIGQYNTDEMLKYFNLSCGKGNVIALSDLADCYFYGEGVNKDEAKSFGLYQKAAELNDMWAQRQLGFSYYYGRGIVQDYTKAFKWFSKSAEQGNSGSQEIVGDFYLNGKGTMQDYEKAVEWYKKSAEQGNASSQYMVGKCFLCGQGVEENEEKAFEWFMKSAENGYDEAEYMVGEFYYQGVVVEENAKEAVRWFTIAAEHDNAEAQSMLGMCYYNGDGVEQNSKEAVRWFIEAAKMEDVNAQYYLGRCYFEGNGVDENKKNGLKWLIKAAEQDDVGACIFLSGCYFKGNGVEKSIETAAMWMKKAADLGDEGAQDMLDKLVDLIDKSNKIKDIDDVLERLNSVKFEAEEFIRGLEDKG